MIEIILAILGIVAAAISIALTNYFSKKNQLIFEERKLKEAHYIRFIDTVSEMLTSSFTEKTRKDFAHIQNNLYLVASQEVVCNLVIFNDFLNASPVSREKHNELLTNLIKAMRADLYGTHKVNTNYPIIELRTVPLKK